MGISSDASIAFGIDLGEEDQFPLSLLSVVSRDEEEGPGDIDEFLETLVLIETKNSSEFPFELILHCSYGYPMYILALKGTEKTAFRGSPVNISADDLEIPEDELAMFNALIEKYDLKMKPGWLLYSLMG